MWLLFEKAEFCQETSYIKNYEDYCLNVASFFKYSAVFIKEKLYSLDGSN